MELQRESSQPAGRLSALQWHDQNLNLELETKKPAIWGNQSRQNGRTGSTMGLQGKPAALTLSLHHLTLAGHPWRYLLKFQKLWQEAKKPLRATGQVARPSQAGAYLPGGFPLHHFHLKRSLGPEWPVPLRPINGPSSGMQSEGGSPACCVRREGGGETEDQEPSPSLALARAFV